MQTPCPHYRSENHFGKPGFCNFVFPLWKEKNMVSFIADWHPNLRHRAGFEAPPLKGLGRDFIEDVIPGAFRHHRTGNVAARGINYHHANAVASDMGPLCLVGILGEWRADRHSFCSRQGHQFRNEKPGFRGLCTGSCVPFSTGFLFCFRSRCCHLFRSGRLLRDRSGLLIWRPS